MDVYAVMRDNTELLGVFDEIELARQYIETLPEHWSIFVWCYDLNNPGKCHRCTFEITVSS